jgi:hypothetical protein
MKSAKEISLYDAIRQMRILSAEERPFSFAHFTWDDDRQKADGLRVVNRALIRPAAKEDQVRHAQFKLFYTDMDLNQPRNCWQPLLAYFNGQRVKIEGYANSQRR